MEEKYVVYMHRNKINGKVYIGQTKNYKKRCAPGNYKGCTKFYNAIQKYGWNNFSHSFLKEGLTQQQADFWECFYIKIFNSTNDAKGYNLSQGGSHKAVLVGENNGFYGKKHSEQSLEIMRKKKYGGNNPIAKKVRCLNTNKVFDSCREASDWCGVARQNIQRCARGERPTAGKHPITKEPLKWRYIEDEI